MKRRLPPLPAPSTAAAAGASGTPCRGGTSLLGVLKNALRALGRAHGHGRAGGRPSQPPGRPAALGAAADGLPRLCKYVGPVTRPVAAPSRGAFAGSLLAGPACLASVSGRSSKGLEVFVGCQGHSSALGAPCRAACRQCNAPLLDHRIPWCSLHWPQLNQTAAGAHWVPSHHLADAALRLRLLPRTARAQRRSVCVPAPRPEPASLAASQATLDCPGGQGRLVTA